MNKEANQLPLCQLLAKMVFATTENETYLGDFLRKEIAEIPPSLLAGGGAEIILEAINQKKMAVTAGGNFWDDLDDT